MQLGKGLPAAGAFFDSDFATIDCVLAQGLMHGLQGKSDCRVAVVTVSRPNLAVAGFVDMVERYYRGPAANFAQVPPVGMRTTGSPGETAPAFTLTLPKLENKVKRVRDTGDPETLIRNYLEAQNDHNSFFVLAGPATNLTAALEFRGVRDLLAVKSNYLVASCNVKGDPAASKRLFADWPTPIYLVSDELAASVSFPGASVDKEFAEAAPDSPFIPAYKAWGRMPYDTTAPAMLAALHAARPKEEYFKVSGPCVISVREDGRTAFTPSAQGRHFMLMPERAKKDQVLRALVELTAAKPVLPQRFRPPAADDKKEEKKL